MYVDVLFMDVYGYLWLFVYVYVYVYLSAVSKLVGYVVSHI